MFVKTVRLFYARFACSYRNPVKSYYTCHLGKCYLKVDLFLSQMSNVIWPIVSCSARDTPMNAMKSFELEM